MTIAFTDFQSNPAPTGAAVSFYPLGTLQSATTLVSATLLGVGGVATAPLTPGESYIALLDNVPGVSITLSVSFTTNADGSATTVQINSFESVTKNTWGYALAQAAAWPFYRFGPVMANILLVATGIGAPLAGIDTMFQTLRASLRLESATGSQVDNWARNYLGLYLLRYSNELDPTWKARIRAIMGSERCTLAAIALVVEAWLLAVEGLPSIGPLAQDIGVGGQDVSGNQDVEPAVASSGTGSSGVDLAADVGIGGQDISGAQDIGSTPNSVPTVIVFDRRSDPASSTTIGLVPGEFCVYLKYGGYANPPGAISASSSDLDAMVRLVKGSGYQPIYADNRA